MFIAIKSFASLNLMANEKAKQRWLFLFVPQWTSGISLLCFIATFAPLISFKPLLDLICIDWYIEVISPLCILFALRITDRLIRSSNEIQDKRAAYLRLD